MKETGERDAGLALDDETRRAWHQTAWRALDAADEKIRPHFRNLNTVTNKTAEDTGAVSDGFDPVTVADRDAEKVIRAAIEEDHPTHGIIGEEFGEKPTSENVRWIIDPIDGTRAFVAGFPTFGTLIGITLNDYPVLGYMSQPFTGERYWGSAGESHYAGPEGTRRLATSGVTELENAVLSTTSPSLFSVADGERARYDACEEAARFVRFGGDCYAYCLLAAGHVDLVIETRLNTYDIAPLIPIIEGAGGIVTDWSGGSAASGGQCIAAATTALHQEVCAVLNDVDA